MHNNSEGMKKKSIYMHTRKHIGRLGSCLFSIYFWWLPLLYNLRGHCHTFVSNHGNFCKLFIKCNKQKVCFFRFVHFFLFLLARICCCRCRCCCCCCCSLSFVIIHSFSWSHTCIVLRSTGTVCVARIILCTAMCMSASTCYLWSFVHRSNYVPVRAIHTCRSANRQVSAFLFSVHLMNFSISILMHASDKIIRKSVLLSTREAVDKNRA